MRRFLQYCTVTILLFMYVGVGVFGHLEVLTLLGIGSRENRVAPVRMPAQKTAKAYWCQHRHIPPTVTVAAPEPGLAVAHDSLFKADDSIRFPADDVCRCVHLSITPPSSRAPPRA